MTAPTEPPPDALRRRWTRRRRRLDNSSERGDAYVWIWAAREIVFGVVFAFAVVVAGFAFFSLWVVIPTLLLTTALVVWWARSASFRRRDARQEFKRRHPSALDVRSPPTNTLPPSL